MGDKSNFLLTLFPLLMVVLYLEASTIRKHAFLVTTKKTWSHARLYCQKFHIDLMSFEMARRYELGPWLVDSGVKQVWIGEHRESWDWSPKKSVLFWTARENRTTRRAPDTPDKEDCALYDSNTEQLDSSACNKKHPYVCLGDNLVLVKEKKTWEDALQHCEDLESQCELKDGALCRFTASLLTLKQSDYDYVRDRISGAETHEVWTGLRFLEGHWFWIDGQELEDEGVLPHCPSHWKHCGTLSKYDTDNWITRDCSEKRNFICIKKRKMQSKEHK